MENNKYYLKLGITLITLVITIVIMIILAGVVLIAISGEDGIMMKAQESVFKQNLSTYSEELENYINIQNVSNKDNQINIEYAEDYDTLKSVMSDFDEKYTDKLAVENNKLVYIGKDETERQWAREINIKVKETMATVAVEVSGSGSITGDGEYKIGSQVTLTSTAVSKQIGSGTMDYDFGGWYLEGELKSTDTTYTFKIEENVTYTAYFIPKYSLIYYLDANSQEQVIVDKNTTISAGDYTSITTASKVTKLETGSSCTTIAYAAFSGCSSLVSIDLSNVVTLNQRTFLNCTSLTTVNSPKVKTIAAYAFQSCTSLITANLGSLNNYLTTVDVVAFHGCTNNKKLKIKVYINTSNGTVNSLPNSLWSAAGATIEFYDSNTGDLVNVIWGLEYAGNTEIDWTVLPNADKITVIRAGAFKGCTNLKLESIPEKMTTISDSTFEGCSSLTNITMPNVTSLANKAFYNCPNLTTINAPKIKTIGNLVFSSCTKLIDVTLGSSNNPVTSISNSSWSETFLYCVQKNLVLKVYIDTSGGATSLSGISWGATNSTIEFYDSGAGGLINVIWGLNYAGNTEIDLTVLPNADKITVIKAGAFKGCTNLKLESIPEKVTSIGASTFEGCTGLTDINLQNVTTIATKAFYNSTNLTTINAPKVQTIGDLAFSSCTKLINVTCGSINNPVTSISNSSWSETFLYCVQKNLVLKVYIDTSGGATSLSGAKWGATNSTVEYYNSATGNKI